MSVTTGNSNTDFGVEMAMSTVEDVSFDRLQRVLHGEYHQARGTLELDEEYDVTVTERDDSYHLQVRGSDGIEHETYVDSDNPYEALPESSEELYALLTEEAI